MSHFRVPFRVIPSSSLHRNPWQTFPNQTSRDIHTSSQRHSVEVLVALGVGFYTKAQWITLPGFLKTASVTVPLVAAATLAIHKRRKTYYDPLLNRRKYILTSASDTRVSNIKFLDGPGAAKANELLHEIIHMNRLQIPYLSHDSHQWQVLFSRDPSLWIDCVENGTLLCSNNLMSILSRNEMVILLSTLVSHVVAKHKTEMASHRILMGHTAAIIAWYYAFFIPILHSYPLDMGILFIAHQIGSYLLFQRKFRSLCLEADRLALVMGSAMGATRQDAISLMQKMIVLRQQLPITSRIRAMCYYEYRVSALKQNDSSPLESEPPNNF